MPLRIAFDLDGVFADMEGELARHARALFGAATQEPSAVSPPPIDDQQHPAPDDARESADQPPLPTLRISPRQQRKLWAHVAGIQNFWETLPEIEPGSLARLAKIATEKRWEVIFLTRRPDTAGATPQVQSQRWLRTKGFPLPSVFVVQGSRGRIAASLMLDIVVDDTPENCLDVTVDSKARAILIRRDQSGPIATKRLGIGVARSVGECLDVLTQLDEAGASKSGVLDRVKQLLGLSQATST